jgi:hypothetical protein
MYDRRTDRPMPGAGRWQDWLAVVIGAVTALSPLWLTVSHRAGWTMVVLGVLIAAAGLWSLAQPGSTTSEYAHIVLGALLFVAPWVLRYTDYPGASWTSWIAGVLAVMAGLGALPSANTAHRVLGQH